MSGINIGRLVREVKRKETIVTRPINEWLLRHGDDCFSPEVVAYVADQIGTQPRIRSGSFSGASAGACLRAQELSFAGVQGEAIDSQLRNIFNDGKWRHLRWQAMLLETGTITHAEYPVFWDDYYSRGTLDAYGMVPDDHAVKTWRGKPFGFELKGVSTFQFGKYTSAGRPIDKHMLQIHHYFVLSGLDLFSYVIEDKTTQEFYEMVIEPEDEWFERAEADIIALGKAVRGQRIHGPRPDCIRHRGDDYSSCPFGSATGACMKYKHKPPKPFVRTGKSDIEYQKAS